MVGKIDATEKGSFAKDSIDRGAKVRASIDACRLNADFIIIL